MSRWWQRIRTRFWLSTEEDAKGEPGKAFSETIELAKEIARRNGITVDRIAEGASNYVQGHANEKLAKSVKDFAEAEHQQIQATILLRTADAKAKKEEADAERAKWEADQKKTEALKARLELFQKLNELGVVFVEGEDGGLVVTKAPAGFALPTLTEEAEATEGIEPEGSVG